MKRLFVIVFLLSLGVAGQAKAGVVAPYYTSSAPIELYSPCGPGFLHAVYLKIGDKFLTPLAFNSKVVPPPGPNSDTPVEFVEVPNANGLVTRDGRNCVFTQNNGVMTD